MVCDASRGRRVILRMDGCNQTNSLIVEIVFVVVYWETGGLYYNHSNRGKMAMMKIL